MKKLYFTGVIAAAVFFFAACGGGNASSDTNEGTDTEMTTSNDDSEKIDMEENANVEKYDPERGQGKFMDFEPGAVDPALAKAGHAIYDTKCQGCHKLTDEKLVGPGWAGVTKRHTGAWILNFVSDPDAMLDQDPELQEQLEICMVRMPNQNLTDEEAKSIYDFMRENDAKN